MSLRTIPFSTLAFVLVPLLFVLLVVLMIALTRSAFVQRLGSAGAPPTPGRPAATNRGCLVAFGAVFVAAGLGALFLVTIRPLYRSGQAAHWPTTPGQVVSSRVQSSHSSDGGTTYRIDIHYRYAVNGRPLESNQYDSSGTRTFSGYRAEKEAIVRARPPGTPVSVHYQPADPSDAMLSTELPPGSIAFIWFPFIFIGAGVGVMVLGLLTRPPGTPVAPRPVPVAAAGGDARGARRRNFIGILVFTLFWNGFITMFHFLSGGTWFLIPFALFGLLLIVFTGYNALQLFNPLVAVQFAHMPIRPGEPCEVSYSLSGNFLALRSLGFTLEGREKVTYRQGTDTRTETHVAWRIPLLDTTSNAQYERGRFTAAVPPDAMTTFAARNNQFTWHLCCRGDIPGRPDIKDEFTVTVLAEGAV